MRSRVIALWVLCLLAMGSLAGVWWLKNKPELPPAPSVASSAPSIGQFIPTDPPRPAPDVSMTDKDGAAVTLGDFRGRVILVNLWATWCIPCVEEMPALDRLEARQGGKDFAVVAISEDRGGNRAVEPFLAKLGLSKLTSYLDPKSAASGAFQVRGLPTSILIDRDGLEVGRTEGGMAWDGVAALALIERQLSKPRSGP